jgi:chemotaxis protein MotA
MADPTPKTPDPKAKAPDPKAKGAKPAKAGGGKPDLATLAGMGLAASGILGGMMLEGGSLKEILQPTAGMIVFGGTIGAVLITTPIGVIMRALRLVMTAFVEKSQTLEAIIEEVIGYASKARKSGIVSLEQDANQVQDPFLRKALNLAVDGTDLQEIRKMMELEMTVEEQQVEGAAKVFEAAGGYSPTMGIIGAVLGLIQVMKNLANIDEVGRGIATAFVATIYGLVAANLIFLPLGTKIKARAQGGLQVKELILEGVSGIVEGLNPKLIRLKLEAYGQGGPAPKKPKAAKAAAAPGAAKPAAGAAPVPKPAPAKG